jgi:hypothetical protein
MVLTFDPRVLDHGPRIGLQAGHGAADMPVNLDDFFDARGFKEGGCYSLFDTEDDTFASGDLQTGLLGPDRELERRGAKLTPIAVEPSLMASREYSTWKRRPSGEKVLCWNQTFWF